MTRESDQSLRAQALHALAETLDVEQAIARVPGLSREKLQALLLDAATADQPAARPGHVRRVNLFTDGASRGNPGLSGAGAVLKTTSGEVVSSVQKFLGKMTNNMAEYTALLVGLKEANRLGVEEVFVYSDSELLIRQINGRYKVKNDVLKIMHGSAIDLLSTFKRWKATHIPREENSEADRLANQAIDERE